MYQLLNYSYSATLPTFSPIYFSQFVDVVTKAKIPNFLVVALDERTVTFLKVRPTPTLTPNPNPNPKQAPGEAEDGSPYGQHQQQLKQLVEAASQARGG